MSSHGGGARVRVFWGPGNTGDLLVREGGKQLFRAFEIFVTEGDQPCDAVFWGGGGNMSGLYPAAQSAREKGRAFATARKVPFIALPQSWTGLDAIVADQCFAREHESFRFCPAAVLAPDLALAYELREELPPPRHGEGWFFRKDAESFGAPANNIADPVWVAKTPDAYLRLAADYQVVHTNRLHFAIAAMSGVWTEPA